MDTDQLDSLAKQPQDWCPCEMSCACQITSAHLYTERYSLVCTIFQAQLVMFWRADTEWYYSHQLGMMSCGAGTRWCIITAPLL